MEENYDVVIAGAGPAGAQAARDIASRGYDVAVLETEAEDRYPAGSNKSTAGTFPRMMSAFSIPDDVVMHYTDSVVLESPDDSFTLGKPGAVLDFGDFKEFLVEDGEEKGAEYFFDSRVFEPIMNPDGAAEGVRCSGGEEFYGDIIIDATGPAAPIAQHEDVEIVDLERSKQAIGIEYELDGVDTDAEGYADLTDAMMLRLDHDIAPGGYSWLFHTGEDTAKVGVCYLQNEAHTEHAEQGMSVDDYLQRWIVNDPRFSEQNIDDIEPLEMHRGSAHIQLPDNFSHANVMAVGDTVPSVDPLWGEGIDTGMKSGRAAATTADEVLNDKKLGKEVDPAEIDLSAYDRRWNQDVGANREPRYFITQLVYNLGNERYNQLMEDLNTEDNSTLAEINNGDLSKARKLIHFGDGKPLFKATTDTMRQKNKAIREAEEWVKEKTSNLGL